jgi:hypothetical protein
MRILPGALAFGAIVLLARPSGATEPPLPSVGQVVDRLNDLFRVDSSEADLTMRVVTDRYRRELTLHSLTRGKDEALIVVRAPAREGGAATLRSKEGVDSPNKRHFPFAEKCPIYECYITYVHLHALTS